MLKRHGKFAGGDIDVGDAYRFASYYHASQEVVAFGGQHCRVDDCARGDDAHNFAINYAFGQRGIAGLLANSDAIAFGDKPRNIAIDGVMRNTRHR